MIFIYWEEKHFNIQYYHFKQVPRHFWVNIMEIKFVRLLKNHSTK